MCGFNLYFYIYLCLFIQGQQFRMKYEKEKRNTNVERNARKEGHLTELKGRGSGTKGRPNT